MASDTEHDTVTRPRRSTHAGEPPLTDIHRRRKERDTRIGQILREARSAQRLTITACSTRLAIPRSRYANIEEGKASCTVAELLDIEDVSY